MANAEWSQRPRHPGDSKWNKRLAGESGVVVGLLSAKNVAAVSYVWLVRGDNESDGAILTHRDGVLK